MTRGFRVIESVLRGDEHFIFNLTVLLELHKIGLLNSFQAKSDTLILYQKYLPFIGGLKSSRQNNVQGGRLLFLTGSWFILLRCLFIKGEKAIIFHNFFSFLEHNAARKIVKISAYKILIKIGRIKPIVLNNNIKDYLDSRIKLNHSVIQIAYNLEIIEYVAPTEILEISIEKALFGNLFPGKVNLALLKSLSPKHFGKLHGGMKYKKSIDKYLSIKDYYNLMRMTDKICILNNNNHRVASGVLADAVALRKKIFCSEDPYIQYLVSEYNLECIPLGNYLQIDLAPLQKRLYELFVRDLYIL